jgi:MFS family permease
LNKKQAIIIFAVASAFVGIALGLSDSILANYFKDAYDIGAKQRGIIELPRELPGVVSMFAIAALSFLGNVRTAIIAQTLGAAGLVVLGIFRPDFGIMLIFIFVYSMGQHMYIPLGDSIGLSLADRDNMGRMLGRFNSVRMAFLMIAGVMTFFGFRYGFFDFDTPVLVFMLSALSFLIVGVLLSILSRYPGAKQADFAQTDTAGQGESPPDSGRPASGKSDSGRSSAGKSASGRSSAGKSASGRSSAGKSDSGRSSVGKDRKSAGVQFVWRKKYLRYYAICALFGGRKQIMLVFSPWVLIDLLGFKADTMSILAVIGSFIGIFFMNMLGKWLDRFGTKRMLYIEAVAFIFIYTFYGFLSGGLANGTLLKEGWPIIVTFIIFVLDRMTMQMGMVRVVYLRSIALSPDEVTATLSAGISMDHVASIVCAFLGGLAWDAWGPQYVFFIAAALSLLNVWAAKKVSDDRPQIQAKQGSEAI